MIRSVVGHGVLRKPPDAACCKIGFQRKVTMDFGRSPAVRNNPQHMAAEFCLANGRQHAVAVKVGAPGKNTGAGR